MKFTLRHIAFCVVVALLSTTALLSATAHQAAEQQTAFSPAGRPFSSDNSHAQNSQRTIPNSQFSLSSQDSIRYNYFFLEAVRQQNAGHYAAAFDLLSHALAINPRAAEAYFARATYFSELQQDSLALVDIAEAARLNPANNTYMERLAIAYINRQDFDKAIATYEELAQRDRTRSDILNILVQLYERQKDYQKMIRAIDRIEENEGSSEEITLYKMRVYDLMGDKKSAYRALKALSDKHPSDLTYRVMLGNWLMQHDRSREAFKIFSAAQREDPDNTAVESSLYDYYKATGQDSVAQSLMERMLISPKTDTKSRISMLQQVIRENEEHRDDSTKIISLLHRMMQANPKSSEIAEVNAAYATLKKLPQDTINRALLHVLHLAPDNAGARLQLIQAEWPTKNWDRIIELASPALQYNPEEMAFYYFMGLAYYQKDERDKALEMFRKGVSEINSQSNADILTFVKKLIRLRKQHPAFLRSEFLTGTQSGDRRKQDISWYDAQGNTPDWNQPSSFLAYFLDGSAAETRAECDDNSFYIILNGGSLDVTATICPPPQGKHWYRLIDTSYPAGEDFTDPEQAPLSENQQKYVVLAATAVVLILK